MGAAESSGAAAGEGDAPGSFVNVLMRLGCVSAQDADVSDDEGVADAPPVEASPPASDAGDAPARGEPPERVDLIAREPEIPPELPASEVIFLARGGVAPTPRRAPRASDTPDG